MSFGRIYMLNFIFQLILIEFFKFSFNFNWVFSKGIFSTEFFSWIFFQLFNFVEFRLSTFVCFSFISWEASCLFEYLLAIQEVSDKIFLLAIFPALTVWFLSLYGGPYSSFQQIVRVNFLMPYCLGLLLPFPLWPKLSATCGRFVSLLEIHFYNMSLLTIKLKWNIHMKLAVATACKISLFFHVILHNTSFCLFGWSCRIHWLHLCRGVRPPRPTSVLDMTLNNLMVRLKWCRSFGNVEHLFIAIAPRSTLAQSGSTW